MTSNFGISSSSLRSTNDIDSQIGAINLKSVCPFESDVLYDEVLLEQNGNCSNVLKTTNVSLHDRHEYIKSKTKENIASPVTNVDSFSHLGYTNSLGYDRDKNNILSRNSSSQLVGCRSLAMDMRQLLNNPQRADIVFIVEDGNANYSDIKDTKDETDGIVNVVQETLMPDENYSYDRSKQFSKIKNAQMSCKSTHVDDGDDGDSMLEDQIIHSMSSNMINCDLNEMEDRLQEMEKNGKRLVYAHRCILMARCELFACMFENGMAESFQREFVMEGISFEVMLGFLEYIYTDEVGLLEPIDIKVNDLHNDQFYNCSQPLGVKNDFEKFQNLICSKGSLKELDKYILSKENSLPKSLEKQLMDILDLYTLADIYLLPELQAQIMKHFELKYFNVSMIGYLIFGIYCKENHTASNEKVNDTNCNVSTIFEQLKIQILHYIVVHTYNWFGYKDECDPYKMMVTLFKSDYTYSEIQNLKTIYGLEEFIYEFQDGESKLVLETEGGRNLKIENMKYDNYSLWKFHVSRTSKSLWPYKMPRYFDDLMRSLLGLYTKTLTGFEQSMGSLRDVYSFHPSNLYRRYLINHVSVAFPSSKGKDKVN